MNSKHFKCVPLELPDIFTRYIEDLGDLGERSRWCTVEPVAEFKHPPLSISQVAVF